MLSAIRSRWGQRLGQKKWEVSYWAQKCGKSPDFLRNQDFSVMRDQFRYMLKIGKIESWSGFELFQPYFLLTISREREEARDF